MSLGARLKDLWTTLPGIVAIVLAVATYVQSYSAAHAWPPTGLEIVMFVSGLLNVFSSITHKPAAT